MLLSLDWLSDYVEHGLPAGELAHLLTMSGLEVEGIERRPDVPEGVVVGHVLETRPHPDADRLTLCSVDLGDGAGIQIVCGAPNVEAGQKVAVATVGTTLQLPSRDAPGRREAVVIRKAKIRGEESNGMICAEDELGLGDSHEGILVLDPEARVGRPFAEYLAGAGRGETILDIAITPNRPDALSVIGVAREVAALTERTLHPPEIPEPPEAPAGISIDIEDPEGCGRYVGVVVRGVKVEPSPRWLRDRLEAVGARSVSNVVDVTNYVMRELGQPLHAFDMARLSGGRIVVRAAGEGESITTLDGVERKVPAGAVLICDANRPVAIAGVMGGANSEVGDATTDILIESAHFDPVRVRRAARALEMSTDASYRFERGVDPTGQVAAAMRAAALIAEVAGGEIEGMVDRNPRPHDAPTILLRPGRLSRLLGARIPEEEATRLLRAIGFGVEEAPALDAFAGELMRSESLVAAEHAADEAGMVVTVPGNKPDVTREADVIEEVARLWGYDRIPEPAYDAVPLQPPTVDPHEARLSQVSEHLVGLGFREAYTNSLVSEAVASRFAGRELRGEAAETVRTLNPVSQEMAVLRPSLIGGLLDVVAYNQARGADALRLYEMGHVYARGGGPDAPIPGYEEHLSLALAMAGPAVADGWDTSTRPADFFDLKGALMHALGALALPDLEEVPAAAEGVLAEHLVLRAGGQRLGFVGRIAPALASKLDLRGDVLVAELNADVLSRLDDRDGPARYIPVNPYPTVERDLAVVVDERAPVGPLLATIREAGRPLVHSVRVFDVYRGDRIPAGTKSVAFGIRMGADHTLTDDEIAGRVGRIVRALESQHRARLRD